MIGIREIVSYINLPIAIVLILGVLLIPTLTKFKFGQTVREEGPQSHLKKNGTPTMGGIFLIIAIVITGLIFGDKTTDMFIGILSIAGFGIIGFIDDFIIIKKKRSLGLSAKQKIIMQVLLALMITLYQYNVSLDSSLLQIPFTSISINIGWLYIPLMTIAIVGTVNAVNLTDGLDGLASGVTIFVSIFFLLFANLILENREVTVLSAATIGACIGFLRFNTYPANIFMGDTGSMALGGAVAAFAVLTNSVLLIPIVGGVYFMEAISVILQVTYFKLTKKRIFKMAPLHHHFEQCGHTETHVVAMFWLVSLLLCCLGILAVF